MGIAEIAGYPLSVVRLFIARLFILFRKNRIKFAILGMFMSGAMGYLFLSGMEICEDEPAGPVKEGSIHGPLIRGAKGNIL